MARSAPYLPDTAPFGTAQRRWLNGFFAAIATSTMASDAAVLPGFSGDGYVGTAPSPKRTVARPTIAYDRPNAHQRAADDPPAYDRSNPFPARLLTCRRLNGKGSAKDTRHLEIALEGSGLLYEPGDALGVVPRNCPELVAALIDRFGVAGDEVISVDGETMTLVDALQVRRDVTSVSDAFLEAAADQSGDAGLAELLQPDRRSEKRAFLESRDYLDLLAAYPEVRCRAQHAIDLMRPLQHRLYSICSSPRAHPGEVHLTVGVVRYAAGGRLRKGVCSTYLSDRLAEREDLPVFVHRNPGFRLPDDDGRPVIMIGPGTGIAPFRAFLEERRATGARGRNWLFFGDQHAATDFLYKDEIEQMHLDGLLERLSIAFSRDQNEKIYVQHRMLDAAHELYAWLEDGAHVYVCGDASRMAKDVDAALRKVAQRAGGLTPEASADYVKRLKREKRYARDVY